MKAKTRQRTIGILISILLFIGFSELLLKITDPLGVNRYWNDLARYYRQLHSGQLPDGFYSFSNWQATMINGARVTATTDQECVIAVVGDSVTFGFGVNDHETWSSLLASTRPDVTILNYGLVAYNSADVLSRVNQVSADGYIYLVFKNDFENSIHDRKPNTGKSRYELTLSRYLLVLTVNFQPPQPTPANYRRFQADVSAMPENTLIVGFADDPLANLAGAVQIQPYTSQISYSDPHPNTEGHREIYHQMIQPVHSFINEVCNV